MRQKNRFFAVVCGIALVGIGAVMLCAWAAGMGRTYTLHLPAADTLEKAVCTQGEERVEITDNGAVETLLALLEEGRQTQEESIQDFPVGANRVVTFTFFFSEGGASTLFAYEKRGRYYIEQPYNGIYPLAKEEWGQLLACAGWEA